MAHSGDHGSAGQAPEGFHGANDPRQVRSRAGPVDAGACEARDIAALPVPDTLAALHVNAETGLTLAGGGDPTNEHGSNEVAEKPGHPVLTFLGKFWGLSAWMLELIIVLSP